MNRDRCGNCGDPYDLCKCRTVNDELNTKDLDYLINVLGELKQLRFEHKMYKREFTASVEACAWMQEDKTLGLQLGESTTTTGVMALRLQRDRLRDELKKAKDDLENMRVTLNAENDRLERNTKLEEELIRARELCQWVINDMRYKAPEQLNECRSTWISKLTAAVRV